MRCSLKYISILFVGVVMGALIPPKSHNYIHLEPACEVYKEVAHIPTATYNNAKLIYTDTDSDTSYYLVNERIQQLSRADTVVFDNGAHGTVKAVDLRGLYVDVSEAEVHAGVSGTPVWFNDEIVAYVSSLQNATTLYCIWAN